MTLLMRPRTIYAFLFPVLLALSAVDLVAQPQERSGGLLDLYPAGDDYFLEVATLPGLSANRSRVVVLFRLTNNLMTFRADNSGAERVYRAAPDLYVEAIDQQGVVVGYGRWSDTVTTSDYRSTLSKRELAAGFVEMELRPGRYTFRYSISRGSGVPGFSAESDTVHVPALDGATPTVAAPLFLDRVVEEEGTVRLYPLILDANASFGHPFQVLIPVSSTDEIFRLDYLLEQLDTEREIAVGVISGQAERIGGGSIAGPVSVQGGEVRIEVTDDPAAVDGGLFLIDDPGGMLEPGSYRLLLTLGTESGTARDTTEFQIRWIDRPQSLGDPTYAIRALKPIATDREIDQLLDGNTTEKLAALDRFWRERDPTPGTLYNEKMVAYYQRVDYAYFNFQTFGQPDGAKTDRGKIYILYGPPTDVVRRLDPEGGPQEVWTYDNVVGQAFIFRDPAESGEYRLVEYYDL